MAAVEAYSLMLSSIESARSEIDLAALVETFSPLLFRVAHSVLRNRAEAEDVVQDTFLRVLERRHSLAEVNNMRIWLVRIAWNLALDRRRRIRPDQLDQDFAEGLTSRGAPADKAIDEAQRMRSVLREIERLPRAERHALLLSVVEELGSAQIAEVLGRTESATRALLFRARTRLRKRLEPSKGGKR